MRSIPIFASKSSMKKNKFTRYVDWPGKYVSLLSAIITGILLVFLVLLITVDVIGRGIFSNTILIADAASGYTLVGIAFLGLACTELAGKHVTVNIFTRRLPPKRREQLEVAVSILTLTFAIWFTWMLFDAAKLNYVNDTVSIDALHIRMWIPYSVGPLGTGMFSIVVLIKLIQKLRGLVNLRTSNKPGT